MSGYAAVHWAYEESGKMTVGQRAVLVALCQHADQDWSCFPSQKRLAEMTCLSEKSVRANLAWLEANGLIVRGHRQRANGSRTTDRYVLNPARVAAVIQPEVSSARPPIQPEVPAIQPEVEGGTITTTKNNHSNSGQTPLFAVPDEPQPKARRKPETPLPDGWRPKPEHVALAAKHGLDGPMEEQKFRAWTSARDQRYRDWDAGFRNHLLREAERSASRQAHPSSRDSWDHIPTPDQVYAQALARSRAGS